MSSKIHFIVSTGSTSEEAKKAQRKMVRSHVTAQRYRSKRKDEVQAYRLKNPEPVTMCSERPPETTVVAAQGASESRKDISSVSASTSYTYTNTGPKSLAVAVRSPASQLQRCFEDASFSRIQELGPEQHEGLWLPFPYSFPTLGSPFDDPFVSMPPSLSPRISKHLFYYVNVLMPQMHPSYMTNSVKRKFRCSRLAQADELALSGISAYSATSRAMLSDDLMKSRAASGFHEAAFDRIYFKGKTIKLVTARLTEVDKAIADTTIGGVCDLIYLETLTGNLLEAATHMSGLRRLAALRQKDNRTMPLFLAARIIACAVKLATLTHTKPLIPFTLKFNISLPLPNLSHLLPDLGTKLINDWPMISEMVDQDFIGTLYDLASMTRHTEAIFEWIFPYTEDDSYYEYINAQNLSVEHRLLSYDPSNRRGECVRLACILYVNTCLVRGFPISAAIIQNVVFRLRDVLKKSVETNDWKMHEGVLFWTLFVSAFCTENGSEDEILVKALDDAVTALSLSSLEDAKALLSRFFYVERIYGVKANDIWKTK